MGSERVILRVKNLTKAFGTVPVLKDLSFSVEEGQVFTLLGPTGSGKTTTLKAIMRFIGSEGEIFVLDSETELVMGRVSFVPQDKSFYSYMTAEKVIRFASRLTRSFSEREAIHLAKTLGVPFEKRVTLLPAGLRSALYLSLSMAQKAELFLLDEPTTGMDPAMREEALEIIRERVIDGASVLMASHSIPDAESISDSIVLIQAGKKQYQGALDDIKATFRVFEFPSDKFMLKHFAEFFAVAEIRNRFLVLGQGEEQWNKLSEIDYVAVKTPDLETFYRIIARKALSSDLHNS